MGFTKTGFGVDSSFDHLTETEARCLLESDVQVYWQCLWTAVLQPAAAIPNLVIADRVGIPYLGGYISLNHNGNGVNHIREARRRTPDDVWQRLDFVSIDVELPSIRVDQVIAAYDELKNLGIERVSVYTSYNAWVNLVIPGNSDALARRGALLNNALWDWDSDVDFPTLPFGGWKIEQVLSEQWSGGTHVCGQFVDRNTFNMELLGGGEVKVEDRVSALESRLMKEQQLRTAAGIFGAGFSAALKGEKLSRQERLELDALLGHYGGER